MSNQLCEECGYPRNDHRDSCGFNPANNARPIEIAKEIRQQAMTTIEELERRHRCARARRYSDSVVTGESADDILLDAIALCRSLQHDLLACRGSLGYPVPDQHSGILSDGSSPINGIAEALHKQLAERDAEVARLGEALAFIRDLYDDCKSTSQCASDAYEMMSEARAALAPSADGAGSKP